MNHINLFDKEQVIDYGEYLRNGLSNLEYCAREPEQHFEEWMKLRTQGISNITSLREDNEKLRAGTPFNGCWNRLKMFVENVQVDDPMSEEEKEMIINMCNKHAPQHEPK